MPNERECLEVMRRRGDRMLPRSCRICGLGPCRRGFPAYKQERTSMPHHGASEGIPGGDATPRARFAEAAREAFHIVVESGGTDTQSAKVHLMSAYEGAERERFADAVYAEVDGLATGGGDAEGFVRVLLAEYDRINA